jgi:predicted transcriptional regulator
MSFLSTTFSIPLWFLIFALACAAPLWIKWYKLAYKKLIKSNFFKKKFSDFDDSVDEEISIFQKATDHWNASVDHDLKAAELKKSKPKHEASSIDQPYVKIVLKTLALNGDAGMLIQSIADDLEIKSNEIKSSLSYLEENEFVEAVETGSGTKYYLAARGKKYCIKRGYIAE